MRFLIVNADEFGLSGGSNRAIFDAHRSGIVTSTTAIVNGQAFSSGAALLPDYPNLGVGVHLNLTEGKAVSEGTTALADATRKFFLRRELFQRLTAKRIKDDDILKEFQAQVARFKNLTGRAPTHLDTHQNIYLHPLIFKVLLSLVKTLSCPIRLHRESIPLWPNGRSRYVRCLGRSLIGTGYYLWTRVADVRTPDHFFHLNDYFADRLDDRDFLVKTFCDRLPHLPRGVSELMVHPAYCDDELVRLTHGSKTMAQQRTEEFYALCDPRLREQIAAHRIELIHFGGLK